MLPVKAVKWVLGFVLEAYSSFLACILAVVLSYT